MIKNITIVAILSSHIFVYVIFSLPCEFIEKKISHVQEPINGFLFTIRERFSMINWTWLISVHVHGRADENINDGNGSK